jgi:hypothetical protein
VTRKSGGEVDSSHKWLSEGLECTVVATTKEYCLDFKVYKIVAWSGENYKVPVYENWDPKHVSVPNYVETIEEASCFIDGFLKWDGCCNFRFPENEVAYLHTCTKQEAGDIGRLLEFVYELGEQSIPKWDV